MYDLDVAGKIETCFWPEIEIELSDGTFLLYMPYPDGQSLHGNISTASVFDEKENTRVILTDDSKWRVLENARIIGFERLHVLGPNEHTAGIKINFANGNYLCYYNNADEPLILLNELPPKMPDRPWELQLMASEK